MACALRLRWLAAPQRLHSVSRQLLCAPLQALAAARAQPSLQQPSSQPGGCAPWADMAVQEEPALAGILQIKCSLLQALQVGAVCWAWCLHSSRGLPAHVRGTWPKVPARSLR